MLWVNLKLLNLSNTIFSIRPRIKLFLSGQYYQNQTFDPSQQYAQTAVEGQGQGEAVTTATTDNQQGAAQWSQGQVWDGTRYVAQPAQTDWNQSQMNYEGNYLQYATQVAPGQCLNVFTICTLITIHIKVMASTFRFRGWDTTSVIILSI